MKYVLVDADKLEKLMRYASDYAERHDICEDCPCDEKGTCEAFTLTDFKPIPADDLLSAAGTLRDVCVKREFMGVSKAVKSVSDALLAIEEAK